jgi:ornithine cyclodeaminase/alanine dehydrogenase
MNERPLYLTEADVARLADIRDAVASLEEAFRAWRDPGTANMPRQRAALPGGFFNLMGSAYVAKGVYGLKAYAGGPAGANFNICLYGLEHRRLLAVFEANLLSQLRTGAASGLATKLMANPDAATLGVLGTGKQARAQVLAVCAVRPIKDIRIFSPTAEHRGAFARAMEQETGVAARAVQSAEAAITGADVIVLITKAAEPVVRDAWLSDGVHINGAGANAANRRELEPATVLRARVLVTDDRSQAEIEAAEFRDLVKEKRLAWDAVHELGDVATGKVRGRHGPQDVTLFKSLGVALEDIAFAETIYRRALTEGVGQRL